MKKTNKKYQNQRGMTLVEIMVVVVIISLVVGVVGISVFGRLTEASIKTTQTQINNISSALDLYRLKFRKYPSTSEGLSALTSPKDNSEPFLKSIPKDAWGNDFIYLYPGTHNKNSYDLLSYGQDSTQGGSDDIGNWETPE